MSAGTHDELRGEVVLYQAADGKVSLDVRLERESLWLSQRQMSQLFDKDTDTIGLHLRNIYSEGELEESATTEESSVVQTEGKRQVRRQVRLYSLDAVISVGYRVNSRRGTQFRIWATGVLRDHVVKGYSVNANRLRDLNQAVRLIADTARRRDLSGDEAKALLAVVADYNQALGLLDDYDHQRVAKPKSAGAVTHALRYEEALRIVEHLRSRFGASDIFALKRTIVWPAHWARSCRPSAARICILASKKRPHICSTSWSRTTPSSMATNALRPPCFSGFWSAMRHC